MTRPGQPPRRGLCRPGAPDALQDQRLPAVRACNLVSSDTARLPYAIYLMPSQDQKGCKGLHSGGAGSCFSRIIRFLPDLSCTDTSCSIERSFMPACCVLRTDLATGHWGRVPVASTLSNQPRLVQQQPQRKPFRLRLCFDF